MKTSVNLYTFRNAFQDMRPDNFSYEGLAVLFDYFEQLEDDMGEEMELDVIGICCDYSEDTIEDIASNYSIDLSECEDDDAKEEAVREYLEEEGAFVGEVAGGFVYRNI